MAMGNVVQLDASGKRRSSSAAGRTPQAAPRPARRRTGPSRSALVLGGGGFTGAVYAVGALRALDLLSVNATVNNFDVYVGTNSGAMVAAALANGISPEEMMRAIVNQVPTPFPDVRLGALLQPNYGEFVRTGLALPLRIARLLHGLARDLGNVSLIDLVVGLAEVLPSGVYSTSGIERYMQTILSGQGRSDDFRELSSELYIATTDLDTCERIVLGSAGWEDVPISTAVAASGAMPMLYKPVKLRGRELIDGGIVSTTNLDIAVEAGAKFIVVVNPLVPYVNDFDERIKTASGQRARRVSDMGLGFIGSQTYKLVAYQRLHEMARQWETRYPGVDIVLIEPELGDQMMFQNGILSYSARVDIARHGFESVTLKLAGEYQRFKRVAARHGVEISASRVRKVITAFEDQGEKTGSWRKILEQTTATLLRQSAQD